MRGGPPRLETALLLRARGRGLLLGDDGSGAFVDESFELGIGHAVLSAPQRYGAEGSPG